MNITKRKSKLTQAVLDLFLSGSRRTTGEISAVGGRSHTRRMSDLKKLGYRFKIVGDEGEDKVYLYLGHSLAGPSDFKKKKYPTRDGIITLPFTLEGPLGQEPCPHCNGTGFTPSKERT